MDTPQEPGIPECRDVHQDEAGVWRAVHASGRELSGRTWEDLAADACAARIATTWRKAWS